MVGVSGPGGTATPGLGARCVLLEAGHSSKGPAGFGLLRAYLEGHLCTAWALLVGSVQWRMAEVGRGPEAGLGTGVELWEEVQT